MKSTINIERVMGIVSVFRMAIERVSREFKILESIPRGCCGPTSTILANILLDQHGIDSQYRWAWLPCGGTHAWLVIDNNIIIDATVDQFTSFDEYNSPEQMPGTIQMSSDEIRIYNRIIPFMNEVVEDDPRLAFYK